MYPLAPRRQKQRDGNILPAFLLAVVFMHIYKTTHRVFKHADVARFGRWVKLIHAGSITAIVAEALAMSTLSHHTSASQKCRRRPAFSTQPMALIRWPTPGLR